MAKKKIENLDQKEEITIEGVSNEKSVDMNSVALALQGIDGLNVFFVNEEDSFLDAPVKKWISFGNFVIDMITGGGLPMGKFIEIIGKKSSAKSTLAMMNCVQLLNKEGGYALILDKEQAWDYPFRCIDFGLDKARVQNAIRVEPTTVEVVFKTIEKYLSEMILKKKIRDKPIVIYWDSIAACTSKSEMTNGYDKSGYKDHAQLISQGHRLLIAFLQKHRIDNVSFVWINQAKDAVQTGKFASHNPEKETFGGKAPSFYSTVRIELEHSKQLAVAIKEKNYVVGIKVKAKTIKNKIFAPLQQCGINVMFKNGMDDISTIYMWMEDTKQYFKPCSVKEQKETGCKLKIILPDGTLKYFNKGKSFRILYQENRIAIEGLITQTYKETLEKAHQSVTGLSDETDAPDLIETDINETDETSSESNDDGDGTNDSIVL